MALATLDTRINFIRHLGKSTSIAANGTILFLTDTPELRKIKQLSGNINTGLSAYNFARNLQHLVTKVEDRYTRKTLVRIGEMICQVSDVIRTLEDNGIRVPKKIVAIVHRLAALSLVLLSAYFIKESLTKLHNWKRLKLNDKQKQIEEMSTLKSTARAFIGFFFWQKLSGKPLDPKKFFAFQFVEEAPHWIMEDLKKQIK